MRSHRLPIVLLAFLGLVAVVPAWTYFTNDFTNLRPEGTFLAGLVLPATVLLFITSWIKPQFAKSILGLFILVGFVVLAPWLWRFIGMVSGQLTDDPLAQFLVQLAVPVILIAYVISVGYQRVRRA